jgi:hypothetical protein
VTVVPVLESACASTVAKSLVTRSAISGDCRGSS